MKRIEEHKKDKFGSRQFLKLRKPENNTYFAYRVLLESELRQMARPNKFGNIDTVIDGKVIAVTNDDVKLIGKKVTINVSPKSYLGKLQDAFKNNGTLIGRKFEFINMGVATSQKTGRKYTDGICVDVTLDTKLSALQLAKYLNRYK